MRPLVSVICISFNHASFIEEALKSVFNQTYDNVEVIVLDDGSSDDSQRKIKDVLTGKEIEFIAHSENIGYTKTFNEGLSKAKGEFVVDFALDDVMKPNFIKAGIDRFTNANMVTGIVYSNADYIDDKSKVIGNHNEMLFAKKMIDRPYQGDIFQMILQRYFICTPTMIIRKSVLDRLEGYDESLAYEDFDFWVRSSRYWHYAYLDEVNMQKRKLKTSMSANRYSHWQNDQLTSVLKVCTKAFHLCKSKQEIKALSKRLNYEYRQCLRNNLNDLAEDYIELLKQLGSKRDSASLAVRYISKNFKR